MSERIPMRKCIGCMRMKPKSELLRFVVALGGDCVIRDLSGKADGRGAYICADDVCVQRAKKSRRLERTFSCKLDENFYEKIDVDER